MVGSFRAPAAPEWKQIALIPRFLIASGMWRPFHPETLAERADSSRRHGRRQGWPLRVTVMVVLKGLPAEVELTLVRAARLQSE